MELIIIIIFGIFFLLSSIRVAKKSERIVIFRLGRFLNIMGPGLVLLVPILDKGVKVNLGEKIPEWQALSKEQLEEMIKTLPEINILT